jgi:hypothetical protein
MFFHAAVVSLHGYDYGECVRVSSRSGPGRQTPDGKFYIWQFVGRRPSRREQSVFSAFVLRFVQFPALDSIGKVDGGE